MTDQNKELGQQAKEATHKAKEQIKQYWQDLILADQDELVDLPQKLKAAAEVRLSTHVFLGLLIGFCFLFIAWSAIGRLDVTSQATGEVLPSSQIKSVQHLEGGIVQSINVKEGDRVRRGQSLIELESTASGADAAQVAYRVRSLTMDVKRLRAELEGKRTIDFPVDLKKQEPKMIEEAKNLFRVRRDRYQNELTVLDKQAKQREHELIEVEARISHTKEAIKMIEEQIGISEDLLKEDITNRYTHLNLLREKNNLESVLDESEASAKRIKESVEEAKTQLDAKRNAHKEELSEKLDEVKRELAELEKQQNKYKDSLQRTVLKAPVEGVVKQVYVFTKGGVVKPGETVVDIMPSEDQLVIDTHLKPQDIGYIHLGQVASIRLASSDSMRFDSLDGKVIYISPDTLKDEKGEPYYKVRIETKRDYFQRGELRYKLYPGVQVVANIQIGKRSVLDYLLDPVFNSFSDALNER